MMTPMIKRWPMIIFVLTVLAIGGLLAVSKMGAADHMSYVNLDWLTGGRLKSYFQKHEQTSPPEQLIVVTSPEIKDITISESFVCQIRSQRHIEVRALEGGYLDKIFVNEGQTVKKGDAMFQILPVLYRAKLDAANAKAELAQLKYKYTQQLVEKKVVSENELALSKAEMTEAQAQATQAAAELNFTDIKAPFDGIVDRLQKREGSLIEVGDILTTLADNSVMWVYFNVPEKYYLRDMADRAHARKRTKSSWCSPTAKRSPSPARSVRSRPTSTIRTGILNSERTFRIRAGCCATGRLGPSKSADR